ncbi:MAG: hypothetical protein LBH27_01445 [Endomicrobium sp.]|jgi:regulator of replication initiation timing|nr:hypothetical protein [Endomicrobium sp.]
MDNVEILVVQIKKIIEKLKILDNENRRLKLEIEYLRKEYERSKKHAAECVLLKRNVGLAICKIERIVKKIDTIKVEN